MADAGLAFADGKQDLQPGGLSDGLQQISNGFYEQYIRLHEYILYPPLSVGQCQVSHKSLPNDIML